MASVPVGPNGSFTLVVTAEHLANRFKDATLPPVLATPVMIMAMENAALNAIKPFLKERPRSMVAALSSRSKRQRVSRPLAPAPMSEMAIDMVRFVERLKTELRLATPSHACVPAIYGSSAWQPWGELSGIRGFLEHKVENVRHRCARQIGAGRRVSYESAAI